MPFLDLDFDWDLDEDWDDLKQMLSDELDSHVSAIEDVADTGVLWYNNLKKLADDTLFDLKNTTKYPPRERDVRFFCSKR